jgi:hypothetical protein
LPRFAVIGLVGVLLAVGATPPPTAPPPSAPFDGPKEVHGQAKKPPARPSSPMDQPIRLVTSAQKSYANVRDYTCAFIKREQVNGKLLPEQVASMKCQSQPFRVHLRFTSPRGVAGQEACYVAGKHNDMMRAKAAGLLGAVGFITVDPCDPRAMQTNRHPITEAGIGNLIDRVAKSWEVERRMNQTQVRIGEYEYNNRKCTRVETIHPDNSSRFFYTYRSVIYFDKETKLPIRFEGYDWPKAGGAPEGDLLECYSYVNLKLNVGLSDADFNY